LSTALDSFLVRSSVCSSIEYRKKKAHFFVYCSQPCQSLQTGKLRVRCSRCRTGAFTVDRDPCCWEDVLQPEKVSGTCQMDGCDNAWAEFYFKCAGHPSASETDSAVPLELIKSNLNQVCCLACLDVWYYYIPHYYIIITVHLSSVNSPCGFLFTPAIRF